MLESREFIKRTALTGAVVWSAPAILSVSNAGAASPPPVCPTCTTCIPSAYGVQVQGTVLGIGAVNIGPIPSAPPDFSVPVTVPPVVTAGLVTVTAGEVDCACTAQAEIDSVSLLAGLITTGELSSIASVTCDCSDVVLDSLVAGLTVGGAPVLTIDGSPNQTLATISTSVGLPPFTTADVDIVANAQSCAGGTRSVDALVITVVVTLDPPLLPPSVVTSITVTLAHSEVTTDCPC